MGEGIRVRGKKLTFPQVLRGAHPNQLENMAQVAASHVRRDGGAGGGIPSHAAASSIGVGGTLFESVGGGGGAGHAAAPAIAMDEGGGVGEQGSIQQIDAKAYVLHMSFYVSFFLTQAKKQTHRFSRR